MDYRTWNSTTQTQIQTNPLNPIQPDPYSHSPHYTHCPQNPNPNPNQLYTYNQINPSLRPPGVDTYASVSSFSHAQVLTKYAHSTADAAASATTAYYQDPSSQNWAAATQEAIRQYGAGTTIQPNGTEQMITVIPYLASGTNLAVGSYVNGTHTKVHKKTKIVQSVYCDICKIDCNSNDVLRQHQLGKKHMKNLEKLKNAIAPPPSALPSSTNPVIGPPENPVKGKTVAGPNVKKRAAESLEVLEAKKKKVLEGGAVATAVKTCTICNVVCNSETVFRFHLAGQKHLGMLKKLSSPGAGMGAAT